MGGWIDSDVPISYYSNNNVEGGDLHWMQDVWKIKILQIPKQISDKSDLTILWLVFAALINAIEVVRPQGPEWFSLKNKDWAQ